NRCDGAFGEPGKALLVEDYHRAIHRPIQDIGLSGGALHDGVGVVAVLSTHGRGNEVAPVAAVEAEAQKDHVAVAIYEVARRVVAWRASGQEVELLVGSEHLRARRDGVAHVAPNYLEYAVLM